MMHETRKWQVMEFMGSDSEFAHELSRITWTPCQGFKFGNLLYLNDATSPDGAQEYGVIRLSDNRQIESIAVSWMTPAELLKAVKELSKSDHAGWPPLGPNDKLVNHLDYTDNHTCNHCR